MTITIRLDPTLYNYIRGLVYAELSWQRTEQLAMKIRTQLETLAGPTTKSPRKDVPKRPKTPLWPS